MSIRDAPGKSTKVALRATSRPAVSFPLLSMQLGLFANIPIYQSQSAPHPAPQHHQLRAPNPQVMAAVTTNQQL
jgi:hypothetical protein